MGDRTVAVSLMLKVGQYVASAGQAAASTKQIVDEVDNLGKTSPSKFNAVTAGAAVAGGALLGMAGYAVKAAMDFDKQMSEVGAVSNATGKQMESMRALAIQAGKDTQYSATEAAAAEAELAKAGITTADIMGGALKGSLSLAAAGQMGLADAATIAAQTMNIFELKGKDVTHIADVLASAANVSAADMHGLGLGLQQVGLVAHQAGFSLEETTGMLAAFADRGLQGSDGATSLKTAIQHLIAPIPQAKDLMDRLGLSVYDTNGHVLNAATLAGNLQKSLGNLSTAERNAALNTLFGSDAIRAANVLYTLGEDGVKKYTDQVNQQGAAADVAAKKTDNLAGDFERLTGSIDTLAITSGSAATGGLRFLTKSTDALVSSVASMPPAVTGTVEIIAGLSGVGLLAFSAMSKLNQKVGEASDALRGMGPAGEKAATGLGAITKWGGIAAGALAVLQLGGAMLSTALSNDAPNVDRMSAALQKYAETGQRAGELTKTFGKDFQQFGKDVKFINGQGGLKGAGTSAGIESFFGLSGFDFSVSKSLERMKALDDGLAGMVKSGHGQDAAQMFEILAAQANNNGVGVEKFKAMLPGYTGALGDMAHAAEGAGNAQQTTGEKARTMAAGLDEAMRAAGGLKNLFDQLNGTQINLTQAQINAEAAVDKLSAALTASGGSLDLNTEKGRAAAQTGLDLARTAAEVAQKTYDQNGSVEQARGVFEAYRQQLINNIATAGGTKQATDASRQAAELLANQIMQMPAFKKIDISTPGLDTAINKVGTLSQYIAGLNDKTVNITTISSYYGDNNLQPGRNSRFAVPNANRWGGLYQHAAVGALRDANIYSAVSSGARYGYAERETGGEFFGPKYGNLSRTRAMATHAVENWWGGHVTWGDDSAPTMRASGSAPMMRGNVGGGGVTNITTVTIPVNAGMGTNGQQVGQQIAEALRPFVQHNGGGSVQVAIMGRQVA